MNDGSRKAEACAFIRSFKVKLFGRAAPRCAWQELEALRGAREERSFQNELVEEREGPGRGPGERQEELRVLRGAQAAAHEIQCRRRLFLITSLSLKPT